MMLQIGYFHSDNEIHHIANVHGSRFLQAPGGHNQRWPMQGSRGLRREQPKTGQQRCCRRSNDHEGGECFSYSRPMRCVPSTVSEFYIISKSVDACYRTRLSLSKAQWLPRHSFTSHEVLPSSLRPKTPPPDAPTSSSTATEDMTALIGTISNPEQDISVSEAEFQHWHAPPRTPAWDPMSRLHPTERSTYVPMPNRGKFRVTP
jgi:hypothetical protein